MILKKKPVYTHGDLQAIRLDSFEEHQNARLEFSIKIEPMEQNKKWIVMSRRIENREGDFSGVIAAAIDSDFFFYRYENYCHIDVDAIALSDTRQNVISTRQLGIEGLFDYPSGLSLTALTGGGLITFDTPKAIVSIYRLTDFPFETSVSYQKDRVLHDWNEKTRKDMSIISALVLMGIAITVLAWSQRKKRKKAENDLMVYQRQLENLVEERTLSLKQANCLLIAEIEERIKADEKFKIAFQTSPDAVNLNYLEDGVFLDINEGFTKILGYSREEVIGRSSIDLDIWIRPDARDHLVSCLKKSGMVENLKIELKGKDGRKINGMMSARIVTIDNSEVLLAITRDITDILKTEDMLRQAQKMEAIGTLAGGIAHDFNNILFPLLGYTEMIKQDLPPESPLQGKIDQVYKAGLRAKDLVGQILTFSRQGEQQLKPLKIQLVLKEVMKLLRSSIPKTIEFRINISPDCGMVMADPTQIHQIIMNLATNAYHAMKKTGGILEVTLTQVNQESSFHSVLLPYEYAVLTVSDTGAGIKKELLEKIFEPYFTTKPQGEGTGLGLSVVQGIVKSYGGDIQVTSEPGKGTNFHVYLPIIKKPAHHENNHVQESLHKGTERILLVDDEDAILEAEKLMIERWGYKVTIEAGSINGLKTFKKDPKNYDLILTDMAMPDMTGIQLAREIKEIRADIPIIMCTGFTDLISAEDLVSYGINGFILKPVIMKDLSLKIREVLDEYGNV